MFLAFLMGILPEAEPNPFTVYGNGVGADRGSGRKTPSPHVGEGARLLEEFLHVLESRQDRVPLAPAEAGARLQWGGRNWH